MPTLPTSISAVSQIFGARGTILIFEEKNGGRGKDELATLRCQHGALPLSYTPTRVSWQAFAALESAIRGLLNRARPASRYNQPCWSSVWNMRSTSITRS